MEAGTDTRDIEQKESTREKQCSPTDITIDLLYRYRHHGRHIHAVVTEHIVRQMVLKERGIKAIALRTTQIHVDDVEDKKRHEEMVELVHHFV